MLAKYPYTSVAVIPDALAHTGSLATCVLPAVTTLDVASAGADCDRQE